MKTKIFAAAFLASVAISPVLMAQQQQGNTVSITGDTKINANAGALNANASGVGNTAENNVGVIGGGSDVSITGDTTINANVGAANANASGVGNCAKNNVGVVGGKPC